MEYKIIDELSRNEIDADLGTVWVENASEVWAAAKIVFRDDLWAGTEDCGCSWHGFPVGDNRYRIARVSTCDDLRQLLADFPDTHDSPVLMFRAELIG